MKTTTVKLTINIGTIDNAKLNLPEDKLKDGSIVEVNEDVAKALISRNWAEEFTAPKLPSMPPVKPGKGKKKQVPDNLPDDLGENNEPGDEPVIEPTE